MAEDLEAAGLERIMQGREAKARLEGETVGYMRGLRFALMANQDVTHPIGLGRIVAAELRKIERAEREKGNQV